jgi:hypothetical protein
MSEGVRGYPGGKCWPGPARNLRIFEQDVSHTGAGQTVASTIAEEWFVQTLWTIQVMLPFVVHEESDGCLHERYHSGLSTLAHKVDLGWGFDAYITDREVDQLLHPSSCVVEDAEQNSVTTAPGSRQIRNCKDRCEIIDRQVVDGLPHTALCRDGQDLLALQQSLGVLRLQVTKERMQDSESVVTSGWAGSPGGLQVLEELQDEVGIELVQGQALGPATQHVPAVAEYQCEGVPIGSDGVGADIPLRGQVFTEELG